MNISEAIINKAIADGKVSSLAFFYKCKTEYANSVCYDYTPQKLAKLTDLSLNTVKKHVEWLKNQTIGRHLHGVYRSGDPMVYMVGNNLCFSRVQPKNHIARITTKGKTLKEIKYAIYGTQIRANIDHQHHKVRRIVHDNRILKHPRKSEKRQYQELKRVDREIAHACRYATLGVRKICSDLKIGSNTVKAVARYLKENDIGYSYQSKKFLARENGKLYHVDKKSAEFAVANVKAQYPHCSVVPYRWCILVCSATSWCFNKDRH